MFQNLPLPAAQEVLWQQKRCESLHCHEERWGSVQSSVIVFSLAHVIMISSPKWKNHCEGPQYNTRNQFIRAIGRLIRNINKERRTDGVHGLPNIWQTVISKRAAILKVHKCCSPVIKAISEISKCCNYFSSNPCKYAISLGKENGKDYNKTRACSLVGMEFYTSNPNLGFYVPFLVCATHIEFNDGNTKFRHGTFDDCP